MTDQEKHLETLGLKLGRNDQLNTELDAVPRALGRGDREFPEFYGVDMWNAYEVSFLKPNGIPVVYQMQATYLADSPNIVESKSFKLYLNSLNFTVFDDLEAFSKTVSQALSDCVQAPVRLRFFAPEIMPARNAAPGRNIDHLEPDQLSDQYNPGLLRKEEGSPFWAYHSHLLRSNCPVTGQPDWGTVIIEGDGDQPPEPRSLLAYLLSYRNHRGFHESCCETIFADIWDTYAPNKLTVACRYTRRGGLDINPIRSSAAVFKQIEGLFWRQ